MGYRGPVTRRDVVVVGAGPAGLAAAAGLRRAGQDPLVIDRSGTIGSAWRTRYDSFRLHTIRWLSGLPGVHIPTQFGRWVARDDFVSYLERYARQFDLQPQLDTALHGLSRTEGGWSLDTSAGTIETARVVLATGASNEPDLPPWSGIESFEPELLHSSAYRRPDSYAGRRVLVVGSGNSGTEVAVDLARHGDIAVELAVRTAPSILRRDVAGVPTQPIGIALRYVPAPVIDPLGAALRRVSIPDLTDQGLPAPKAPFTLFRRTGTIPVLDHGFVDLVRTGAIRIRPGVASLDGTEVVHTDGSRTSPDTVIAATGYRTGLEPLLGPLGLLDDRGLPTVGARGSRTAPGLYSVGISIPLSGLLREIGLDARRLARSWDSPTRA